MKIEKLYKILAQAIRCGHGSKEVFVDKPSLNDGNGTFDICSLESGKMLTFNIVDGDGGLVFLKNGTEKLRAGLILSGRNL